MLMVISLLTALAFLGFFFFAFVSADRDSAAWFSSQLQVARQDEDPYFDFALEQLFLGPKQEYTNSALYGGKHSLVPNMIGNLDIFDELGEVDSNNDGVADPWEDLNGNGVIDVSPYRNGDSQQLTDMHPYNGRGVTILYTMDDDGNPIDLVDNSTGVIPPDGIPDGIGFDYDGDGIADPPVLNLSAGAFSQWVLPGRLPKVPATEYHPDVDYTYPDINNTYLAHMTWVPVNEDRNGNGSLDPGEDLNGNMTLDVYNKPVWIPSFHRPQYMPEWRLGTVSNPWTDGTYTSRVLRPHIGHQATYWDFGSPTTPVNVAGPRYNGTSSNFFDAPNEGLWRDFVNTVDMSDYDYDIDADGDGNKEAIYLDLDYPVENFEGIDFIPLFGFTVLDAEGLINLNASGNLNHVKEDVVNYLGTGSPAAIPRAILADVARDGFYASQPDIPHFFSASNQGYTTFEINPARALFASAAPGRYTNTSPLSDVFAPYEGMFGVALDNSTPTFQTANFDLFRMIAGAPKFTTNLNITGYDADPGRYGEGNRLVADLLGIANPMTGLPFPTGPLSGPQDRETLLSILFPNAGGTRSTNSPLDDDNDNLTGAGQGQLTSSTHYGLAYPPSVHPVDVRGTGNVLDGDYAEFTTSGATRRLFDNTAARVPLIDGNPSVWLHYEGNWQTTWSEVSTDPAYKILPWAISNLLIEDLALLPGPLIQGVAGTMYNDGSRIGLLYNEDDELVLEPDFIDQSRDSVFSAAEMEGLHFADGDYNRPELAVVSRLRKLMAFNLEDHNDAEAIRKQFTTVGWDRREFSFAPSTPFAINYDTNSDGTPDTLWMDRRWEFNLDITNINFRTNSSTQTDYTGTFPPAYGLSTERTGMNTVADAPAALPYADEDPFRASTRRWLSIVKNRTDITNFLPQRKLLTDQVLEFNTETNAIESRPLTPHPVFDATNANQPMFLLEHSNTAEKNAALPYDRSDIAYDRIAQEWWARYDRQRMARDIYVLLYTLCGPDDLNPTTDTYGTDVAGLIDSDNNAVDDRIEKMAQFAVNFVDFVDPDDCITRFEYDTDLTNGWQFNHAQIGVPGSTSRVVYGVEAQSLTFSEAQWIFQRKKTSNPANTHTFDTDAEDRHYLFVELRNALPKYVDLSSGSWRIRRLPVSRSGTTTPTVPERRLVLAKRNLGTVNAKNDSVAPGGLFSIGTHNSTEADGTNIIPSAYRARFDATDTTTQQQFKLVSPTTRWDGAADVPPNTRGAVTTPACNLDLVHGPDVSTAMANNIIDSSHFVITNDQNLDVLDPMSAPAPTINGEFFNPTPDFFGTTPTGDETVEFVLERRMNLNHAYNPTQRVSTTAANNNADDYGTAATGWKADNEAWNEWVEVDRIKVQCGLVTTNNAPTTATPDATSVAQMRGELLRLNSKERQQPLYASGTDTKPAAAPTSMPGFFGERVHADAFDNGSSLSVLSSSIGSTNSNSPAAFTTWQPHFDRNMTSVIEAASIPLFGPTPLSEPQNSNWIGGVSHALVTPVHSTSPAVTGKLSDMNIAARWFFTPKETLDPDGIIAFNIPQNRWYRLFEFLEVEPQIHQSIANLLSISRTPGRINLNTTRATVGQSGHPQANYLSGLAALIDDEVHQSLTGFSLVDPRETSRDWGKQFRVARDGYDPGWRFSPTLVANIPMPGAIGSKPFRPLGFLDSSPPTSAYLPSDESLQQTILRSLPYDTAMSPKVPDNDIANSSERRPLFEARTFADANPTNPLDNVDYHTRNRLLAKIDNNSTTVSNVFYVFIALEFFEAQPQGDSWSIGRKLTDEPSLSDEAKEKFKKRRGFFVVDRSLLEKAYDPTTGRIDFRKLILHRRKLEPYN